jgi:hypothetical protein
MRKFTTVPRRRVCVAGAVAVATMAMLTVGGVTLRPAPSEAAPPCRGGLHAFFVGTWVGEHAEHSWADTFTIRQLCESNDFTIRWSTGSTQRATGTFDRSGAPTLTMRKAGRVDTYSERDPDTLVLVSDLPGGTRSQWTYIRS